MIAPPAATAAASLNAARSTSSPGTIDDWRVSFVGDSFTTHAKAEFSGFVTKCAPTGIKDEENLEYEVEVQLTTIVTQTTGS